MAEYNLSYTSAEFVAVLAKAETVSKTPVTEVTASRDLASSDKNSILKVNSSSDVTITVRLDSVDSFDIGDEVALLRYGSGEVIVASDSGVTLNSADSKVNVGAQYQSVILKKMGSDEWLLMGSLA